MEYVLYQLPVSNAKCFTENKSKVSLQDYCAVYKGELPYTRVVDMTDDLICEDLFTIFNTTRPEHFAGRSLAVSDIIELFYNNKHHYYYCDSFGWVEVTDKLED